MNSSPSIVFLHTSARTTRGSMSQGWSRLAPIIRERNTCAMQEHKWRYFVDYIKQGKGKEGDYIEQIRKMETSIRACYFESFDKNKEKFVETMLLDSCFIIQLFLKWRFEESDQVRNMGWALPLLMADLTMMENQIPYDVLEKMYNFYSFGCIIAPDNLGENQPKLTKFLVACLQIMYNENEGLDPKSLEAGVNIKHLLHLYYLLFVPHLAGYCEPKEMREEERSPRMIPSLRELKEYEVKFKKKKNCKNILDISFKNGVLEIPYIVLEESIRSKFLNLITFEQCISTDKKHLTSYAVFMDCLINRIEMNIYRKPS